jgi:hypothetical protein
MPCRLVSSDGVALDPVAVLQTECGVWRCLAGSGEIGCVGPWFGPGLPDLPVKGEPTVVIRITDGMMVLEIGNSVVATARFSEHAAADGHGAWIVSPHPTRLFRRNQAITALTLADGNGEDDPFAMTWRKELFL